jgi:hypothetical protein
MVIDANQVLEASLVALRAARDLVALKGGTPVVRALDQMLVTLADLVEIDEEIYERDVLDRAQAIGLCPECGTDCAEGGAKEDCDHPAGCGALKASAPRAAEALRTMIRERRAASARRKLSGRPAERCHDECPGWFVTDCGAVQRCDDCWARLPDDLMLFDDDAAALPEAMIALASALLQGAAQ